MSATRFLFPEVVNIYNPPGTQLFIRGDGRASTCGELYISGGGRKTDWGFCEDQYHESTRSPGDYLTKLPSSC